MKTIKLLAFLASTCIQFAGLTLYSSLLLLISTLCFIVALLLKECAICASYLGLPQTVHDIGDLVESLYKQVSAIGLEMDRIKSRYDAISAKLNTLTQGQA